MADVRPSLVQGLYARISRLSVWAQSGPTQATNFTVTFYFTSLTDKNSDKLQQGGVFIHTLTRVQHAYMT